MRSIVPLSLLSLTLGSLQSARADEVKIYPGRLCSGLTAPAPPGLIYSQGRAGNTLANDSIEVGCPFIKDILSNPIDVADVRICVVDDHPTENVICVLHSNSQDGDDVNEDTVVFESSGDSDDVQCLSTTGSLDTVSGRSTRSPSYYYAACQLPPQFEGTNYIVSIRLEEVN